MGPKKDTSTANLPKDLIKSIGEDIKNLAADVGEVGLDQLLNPGILKEIPIIGSLAALAKMGISAESLLFYRQVVKFFDELIDIPRPKLENFVAKMEADPKFRDRVGENLLLRLHRVDDTRKPTMLARAFKAWINEDIDRLMYEKLKVSIDRIKIYNIPALKNSM